jgi:hypothetical protein
MDMFVAPKLSLPYIKVTRSLWSLKDIRGSKSQVQQHAFLT